MATETEISHERGFHVGSFHSWCPACVAQKEQDAAEAGAQNAAEIDRLTCTFADQIDSALSAAWNARQAIADLVSDRVYDIELAESTTGADALAELDAAMRALRNAQRIAAWRRSLMLEDPAVTP